MVEWSRRQRWFATLESRVRGMLKEQLALCGRCLATEIILRAAKQAEIVSRSRPSAAKT
jgi:hypothetical protein